MAATNVLPVSSDVRLARHFTSDDSPDGCWLWNGALSSQGGYPGFCDDVGNFVYAHRLSYELANGRIPARHHVHHSCGQRRCVRPEHLQALTPDEHRALHAEEYRDARIVRGRVYQRLRDLGLAAREIASLIGCKASTVRRLINDARAAQSAGELQAVTA